MIFFAYTGKFGHSGTSSLAYLIQRHIYDSRSILSPSRDSEDLADRASNNRLALSNLR